MFLAATFLYTESPIHPTKVATKNTWTHFFNNCNVLFLMNLHSPSQVKHK